MNIVHCAFEMQTGGSQVLVVDLLNELCLAHQVALVIINDQYNKTLLEQLRKEVCIYYIDRKQGSYSPLPFLRLNRLLSVLRPQIIHCHEYNTSRFIWIKTPKLVYTVHAIGLPVQHYHRYHLLAAISIAVCNDVRARCTLPVQVIYNGIKIDQFRKRTSYIPGAGGWKLVQVGRLVHSIKGQDVLLHALHRIVYEHGVTDVSLHFIGAGESLPYLQAMVSKLKLEPWVQFRGDQERSWLFEHLADYHLLVQPSRMEGFGLTMLEGLAAGLPVLASAVYGPAEIMPLFPSGFLFGKEDDRACAVQIMQICSLFSNNKMEALTAASRAILQNKFSLEACAQQYLEGYKQLTGQG